MINHEANTTTILETRVHPDPSPSPRSPRGRPSSQDMISQDHFIPTDQDVLEAEYLIKRNRLRYVRIALFALVLVSSLAIVGCTAHPLLVYHRSHAQVDWWLPLWPQHFDLRPTHALVAAASAIAGMSLLVLEVSLVPSVSSSRFFSYFSTHVLIIRGSIATTSDQAAKYHNGCCWTQWPGCFDLQCRVLQCPRWQKGERYAVELDLSVE